MSIIRNLKLVIIFFLVSNTLFLSSITSSQKYPYADHCGSLVPEYKGKQYSGQRPVIFRHTGYYYTHPRNSSFDHSKVPNSLQFISWGSDITGVPGLFRLHAVIRQTSTTFHYDGNSTRYPGGYKSRSIPALLQRRFVFRLNGFWSVFSGKICMVGEGFSYTKQGRFNHHAVLKIYNLMNSTNVTSLISGTLESLITTSDDLKYFNPISIMMLPRMYYQYSLASNISDDNSFSGESEDHDHPGSLELENFCSILTEVMKHEFDLKYSNQCISAKNCTPLGVSDYFPRFLSLGDIDCMEDKRSLRVLVEFADSTNNWYQRPFSPNTTLVAEGSWDAKKREIHFVACQIIQAVADSFNNSHVGDCSTRLSLRFPAIWTIGHISSVVGLIWSSKSKTEAGYFEKITFQTRQNEAGRVLVPGPKYEYTKLDQVNKLWCQRQKTATNNHKKNKYPSPISYDMKFDMSARSSMGEVAWGNSAPLSVSSRLYELYLSSSQYSNSFQSAEDEKGSENSIQNTKSDKYSPTPLRSPVTSHNNIHSNRTSISYRISIQLFERSDGNSSNITHIKEMQIIAEGFYDETEGSLCMTGCRHVGLNRTQHVTEDCEILVNIQFPPTNQNSDNTGFIKARIESNRKESDRLHFERLVLTSGAGYMVDAGLIILRREIEITWVLMSTTLAYVCVALQLLHVKKHPDVLPSISILMLVILIIGYMISIDATITHNTTGVFLGSRGGWFDVDVHEVIVRVITMVSFLSQFHLLQKTWSARSVNVKQKELWDVEKKVLPLYIIGAFAATSLMMNTSHQRNPIFGALKVYAGSVLDGFLLPQILLSMVCNSKEKVLSVSFYFGTTLVRVLPHAYDLYRRHSSAHRQLDVSCIYACPDVDFYSTSWDVIILIGGLLFSLIIFIQQKFGGRCFLPQKLRELGSYEEVPTVNEVELQN